MNLWSVSERKWALESEAKSKIEILELISVPKHARDSFILIMLVSMGVSGVNHIIWIYLHDADVFLQFSILLRILELISVPKHSRDSFILKIFNTLSSWRDIISVHGS